MEIIFMYPVAAMQNFRAFWIWQVHDDRMLFLRSRTLESIQSENSQQNHIHLIMLIISLVLFKICLFPLLWKTTCIKRPPWSLYTGFIVLQNLIEVYHVLLWFGSGSFRDRLGVRPANERRRYIHCNDVSHWLSAHVDWSLFFTSIVQGSLTCTAAIVLVKSMQFKWR